MVHLLEKSSVAHSGTGSPEDEAYWEEVGSLGHEGDIRVTAFLLSPLAPTKWAASFHMGFSLCYSASP